MTYHATPIYRTISGDAFIPEHADGGDHHHVVVSYTFDLPEGYDYCPRNTEGAVAVYKPDGAVWKYIFKPKYSVEEYEVFTGRIEDAVNVEDRIDLIRTAQQHGVEPKDIREWDQEFFCYE